MALNVTAGQNLRKHREEKLGWYRPKLAKKLGASVQTVSNWETKGIPDERIEEIEKTLDVTLRAQNSGSGKTDESSGQSREQTENIMPIVKVIAASGMEDITLREIEHVARVASAIPNVDKGLTRAIIKHFRRSSKPKAES